MGISHNRATQHVNEWKNKLAGYEQIKNWPYYLFHLCHVLTAAKIFNSGLMMPRADQDFVVHDVANQGALNNNADAHQCCRFYFRPKTLFQFSREGIRSFNDFHRAESLGEKQLSVPIMLVFDFVSILTLENSRFTSGSAAKTHATYYDGDNEFNNMNFEYIYNDSGISDPIRRKEIHNWRMSEVVVPDKLPLSSHLKQIICRTKLDMLTLKNCMSASDWELYKNIVRVEGIFGSCFLHKWAYLQNIYFDNSGLLDLELRPITYGVTPENYNLSIRRNGKTDIEVQLKGGFRRYTISHLNIDQNEIVELYLEGALAYKGKIRRNMPSIL